MRRYAIDQIDPSLDPQVRRAIQKGIDDAVYGLMMIIDGVNGALSNDTERVQLRVVARHLRREDSGREDVINEMDLGEGDGMCMGYHAWKQGDFGAHPLVSPP
jgi:hypothetical protein